MKNLSHDDLLNLHNLARDDPRAALAQLRAYDTNYADDSNLLANSGGLLVDIGLDLREPELVLEGIARLERFCSHSEDADPHLLYNLANGYSNLNNLKKLLEGNSYHKSFDPSETSLTKAKFYYLKALACSGKWHRDLQAQIRINYANCLSGLGRTVEAIDVYDEALKYVPQHPMALGNLAIELSYFAAVVDNPIFLFDAREQLNIALSNPDLDVIGGVEARDSFMRAYQRINESLQQVTMGSDGDTEPIVFPSEYERHYVDFCALHQLYLNFCLHCRRCRRYATDSVSFSLITDINDMTSFIRLSRVVNEIKERYAFARFLLFESTKPCCDAVFLDEMTSYVDNLDYAVYGIRAASLKLAFESAYNIFDKMAHFINDYLHLGVTSVKDLTFTTNGKLWHDKKGTLRPEILNLNNWHLYGLYDVARDLDIKEGNARELRLMRNRLTHEYLLPHLERIAWVPEADGEEKHILWGEMFQKTVTLLKLVRSAIFYLIAFIDTEERKRHSVDIGFVAPMSASRYDARLVDSAIG